MRCERVRDRLVKGESSATGPLAEHLAECARCASFAQRLEETAASLRSHHAGLEPPPRVGVARPRIAVPRLESGDRDLAEHAILKRKTDGD